MITLRGVEKSYEVGGSRTFVLRNIDTEVKEGEFLTIMGPSGAGKTTLLNIVAMFDGNWQGEYYLYDQAVHELNTKKRNALNKQYLGFVFQQYHLLDDLTVAENLDIPLSYRDVKRSERQGTVADVKVLRPLGLGLTESAVEAAWQWRFEPSTLDGRPVSVIYQLSVIFTLSRG